MERPLTRKIVVVAKDDHGNELVSASYDIEEMENRIRLKIKANGGEVPISFVHSLAFVGNDLGEAVGKAIRQAIQDRVNRGEDTSEVYAAELYSKKVRQEKAKILREAAKEELDHGLHTWKGDQDMIDMVRADARDMRKVAQFIRVNQLDEARRHAQHMDTAAREKIPDDVWYWLTAEAA